MQKDLFAYKCGDLARGNWQWAVGAAPRIPEMQPALCVATLNFHGAIAAGYDPEKLAPIFAEAPAMLAALRWAEKELTGFQNITGTPDSKLAEIRAILARIEGEG